MNQDQSDAESQPKISWRFAVALIVAFIVARLTADFAEESLRATWSWVIGAGTMMAVAIVISLLLRPRNNA